jgi:hypothetical protein
MIGAWQGRWLWIICWLTLGIGPNGRRVPRRYQGYLGGGEAVGDVQVEQLLVKCDGAGVWVEVVR